MLAPRIAAADAPLDDARLVELARAGRAEAFRAIMQRYNRRLYRAARGVLGDDSEAEDVVQEAYVRGFQNLDSFRGDSSLATWLTRIALNEALTRRRRRRPLVGLDDLDALDQQQEARVIYFPGARSDSNPEVEAGRSEVRGLLERAIDDLPEAFRLVFVLREVEQMSVEETAKQLSIRTETVKTRLHRARRLLRKALQTRFGATLTESYAFDGARCERTTDAVMRRLETVIGLQGN